MGILLCEQIFRNVWIRNESVRAEIGQILHTDTHPHTTAAKLVVRMVTETNVAQICLFCRINMLSSVYFRVSFYNRQGKVSINKMITFPLPMRQVPHP